MDAVCYTTTSETRMQFVGIRATNGLIPKINVNDFAIMMILLLNTKISNRQLAGINNVNSK